VQRADEVRIASRLAGALGRRSDFDEPPVVTGEMMEEAFGRFPGLRTPPAYPEARVRRLLELAGVALAA
jgi:hypothetical protein